MFSEVFTGMRRNITMTIAMILTTAISLCLLGAGLIVARMTSQMKTLYGDKVEVTINLTLDQSRADPNCQQDLCKDLGKRLDDDPDVASKQYVSQAEAWKQYQQIFANQPEMLAIGDESALNASYHVQPSDPEQYKVIQARYANAPGVDSVTDQSDLLDSLFKLLNGVRNATIIVALVQALAALLLISNMVQIAAFTRRTETSIMRLVGASRWRTQLPFIVEAVVSAVVGAVVAIGGLIAGKYLFVDKTLGSIMNVGILPTVDGRDLVWVAPWLGGAAIALAAVSSYVTLRAYVRL